MANTLPSLFFHQKKIFLKNCNVPPFWRIIVGATLFKNTIMVNPQLLIPNQLAENVLILRKQFITAQPFTHLFYLHPHKAIFTVANLNRIPAEWFWQYRI